MLNCLVFALASSLSNWLLRNGAVLSTEMDVDAKGLRGLKWKDDNGSTKNNIACQIPLCCALVEANVNSLACRLIKEYELGHASEYSAYLEALPRTTLNLGCSWSDAQMERLLHDPTIQYFKRLRDGQDKFVDLMLEKGITKDRELAERAYNIVYSRAVEGRFGRQGTVRAACTAATAGLFSSVGLSLGPVLFGQSADLVSSDMTTVQVTIEAIIPLIASFMALAYIVSSNQVNELALVPWIDLANHDSSSSPCVFEYNLLKDAIALKTTERKQEWVTFSYGGKKGIHNDRLLGEYGFVEVDNPNDILVLQLHIDSVTIGRSGKIQEASSLDAQLVESAIKLRLILSDPVHIHPPNESDPVDVERAKLAELWRQEKIRLLDEFLLTRKQSTNMQDEKESSNPLNGNLQRL